ncbi:MAG: hypothetical protein P1R74_12190 [Sedimenticola sp.]|nr:hypothetical protein [Sedimenticola sp.]
MSDSKDKKTGVMDSETEEQSVSTSRRNFTKASLLATPVLMSVASKPVWATTGRRCTVSVLMSGDTSVAIDWTSCRSCSPGYWHHDLSCWSTAGMAGEKNTTFGVFFLGSFNTNHYYPEELEALNTPLSSFFPSVGGNRPFMKFARAATASYLNAMAIGHLFGGNIPTAAQIQSLVSNVFKTYRTGKPSQQNLESRRALAGQKATELSTYYDEGLEECVLPNSGNCPEQGFRT